MVFCICLYLYLYIYLLSIITINNRSSCQSRLHSHRQSALTTHQHQFIMQITKEETNEDVRKCPTCPLTQKSHIVVAIACSILVAFALASGIALFASSAQLQNVSGLSGLSLYIMVVSVAVSAFAVGAVVCSWRKITWYLHFYEFVCLLMFVAFVLTLIAVLMINRNSTAPSTSCYSPSNYFEFKLLEVNDKAQSLLCSPNCPCPTYTTVQQCPAWQSSPYDLVMEQLESEFMCTGWCSTGSNRFMFTTGITGVPMGSCQSAWLQWVVAQWRAVIGCLSAMLAVLFTNVLATNIRILDIWKQEQSEGNQEHGEKTDKH